MSLSLDITTLDPVKIVNHPDWPTVLSVLNGLVRYVPGQPKIEADLAQSWKVSPDGRVYTFALRKGVQFHQGYGEMTAEDVKFSYDRALDPKSGSRFVPQYRPIKSVSVVDKYTVRIELHDGYPDFLAALVAWNPGLVISKKAFEKIGPDKFGLNPVGTGAYYVESYTKGEKWVFRSHKGYWRGRPAIDKVEVQIIPEETVSVLSISKNQLDYTFLRTAEALEMARSNPGIAVTATPVLGSKLLWMNMRKVPFDSLQVRRAMAYAVNRKALVDTVMKGQATTEGQWSPIPPGMFGHTADVPKYDYDPAKAKELLAQAGYPNGVGFSVQFRRADRPAMEAVQAQWAAVGLRAKLEEMDNAAIAALQQTDDWHVLVSGPTRVAPDQLMVFYHSKFQPKFYGLADDLIEAQRREINDEKRKSILYQIQRKINTDVPSFPIYRALYVTIARKGVTGVVANTHFWLWYWEVMDVK
jgi:peptide/nickel transport system substrate-binding protein